MSSTAEQIVALAQRTGLQGFAAATDVMAITKKAALADADKDAAEIVALARRVGLQGFEAPAGEA